MKVSEIDLFFLSYDEPNADVNFSDLYNKAVWTKRIHGIKGSDAAHKAAAEQSETDWFVTVDADNIVYDKFFDLEIDTSDPSINVYGWCGFNLLNGLRYGNGGIKIWNKHFVLNMKTHEAAETKNAEVDFCWEEGYRNHSKIFSNVIIDSSPKQAWRAGFREGVKMTLLDGVKVPPQEIKERIWWHNLHRLKIWSTIGMHKENGIYAILGSRQGTWMTNCSDWNYVDVRDFLYLDGLYEETVMPLLNDKEKLIEQIKYFGNELLVNLGLNYPFFDSNQSEYMLELYDEVVRLSFNYYMRDYNV